MTFKLLVSLTALFAASSAIAQTKQQTDNLYTFARLYGYVRHFHPADANVVTDWDKFAIYGAGKVEKAASTQELQQTLQELFKDIAPGLVIHPSGAMVKLPDLKPADTKDLVPVSWQHNGYGPGTNSSMYKSIRTNSYIKSEAPKGAAFSTITKTLDGKAYQGRKIRYSAATQAVSLREGTGQLWLRVDRESKEPGLFDNMANRPVTGVSQQWRRDTITGTVDKDAMGISIGCFITKTGSLLLDDVKLEVETGNGWEVITALNGDFENDKPDSVPGNWWHNPADKQFIVKTSHRAAASGRQSLLLERKPLVAGFQATTALFPEKLPFGTMIKQEIGSGLAIAMPAVLWGDRKQTYPLTDTASILAQQAKHFESLPEQINGDNLYVRLATVIITWNVFQHFHPYYQEWTTNWKEDLRIALADCYKNANGYAHEKTLKTLTGKMHDGHISVVSPYSYGKLGILPLKWEWLENQLVITQVLDTTAPVKRGQIVTAINGMPAAQYIADFKKTISAGSPNAQTRVATGNMIVGFRDSVITLTLFKDGKTTQEKVGYNFSGRSNIKAPAEKPAYREIEPGVLYVDVTRMPWKEMKQKITGIASAKTIIFDLRGYPKDENGQMIISHLLSNPENDKWMQLQRITLPDHEHTQFDNVGWNLKPLAPRITGKAFFLTDGRAISYAESVMGFIKDQQLATIIGEPTAGANGDVNRVNLPGGYMFSFTGLKVINHDGTQHFMKGIQPDVTVTRTIKAVLAEEDEVLNKAMELSRQ